MKKFLVITFLSVTSLLNSSRIQSDTLTKDINNYLNKMKNTKEHITIDANLFVTMAMLTQIFGPNNLFPQFSSQPKIRYQQSQNIKIPLNQTNISKKSLKKSMYPIKNGSKYHNSHKFWNNRDYRQK